MKTKKPSSDHEESGVDDVRRAREAIARQHKGDLAAHIAETNRIGDELRKQGKLGPIVKAPPRGRKRSGTQG